MAAKSKKAKSRAKPAAKPAAKKSPARPAAARKPAPRPAPAPKKPAAKPVAKAVARPVVKPAPVKKPVREEVERPIKSPFNKKDLEGFRKRLLELRDKFVDRITFLAGENLQHSQREAAGDLSNYGMHMADQGTDNFDRDLALNLVSNEQELIYEIDEALHRITSNTYGVCELTGKNIEVERLKAIPYARYCREAQEEMERGRKRYRPFGPSMMQTPDGGA